MVTFSNIIKTFNNVADNHYVINSFHSGFLDEVDINKMDLQDFPILYCEPGSATIEQGVLTYSVTLFVLDVLKEDLTNRNDVWTNTLEITQDIIADFKQNMSIQTSGGDSGKKISYADNEVVIEMPINSDPFTARFANILSGWSSTISLQVNNTNNLCNAPINPSDSNPNI